ncbi:PTS transporter subunit IIC, partial [Limosilactobacillus fermentum]
MKEVITLFEGIVTTPAILVGLVAMLGLILQKKHTTEIIQGSIK